MNFLDQFAAFLEEPNVKSNLNEPASEQDVEQVEKALEVQSRISGFQMPPSYRVFLLRYDGGIVDWERNSAEWDGGLVSENDDSEGENLEYYRPEKEDEDEGAWIYIDFLSVGKDKEPWNHLMHYNSEESVFMNHEIKTYFPFEPLVVFANNGGGNFWAFDPRYKREDGEMPVRYCDHETGDIYAQAEDFAAFLLTLSKQEFSYSELENPM